MVVFRALAAVSGFALISVVQAQTSNVTCPAKLNYLLNSEGQTPCLISAYLQQACTTNGRPWNVPILQPGMSYIGPQSDQATYCSCSSVVYSLTSACAACQSHQWIPWSNWIVNCTQQTTTLGEYPLDIPVGTSVPDYAYLDVALKDTFNLTQAQGDKAPESTYFGTPTASINYHLTSASATFTLTPASNPSSGAVGGNTGGGSKTNVGAIVGGVIGGVIVLALIAILVFLLLRRNKKNGGGPPSPVAYYNGEQHQMTAHPNGIDYGANYPASPTLYSESQPTTTQKLYDPSDPSTFPQTPASFAYQSTAGDMSHVTGTTPSHQLTSGQYTGAAEI